MCRIRAPPFGPHPEEPTAALGWRCLEREVVPGLMMIYSGPAQHREIRMPNREPRSVASAYLALLADRGVEHLFGNAGTDFAPLIEAYAQAAQDGIAVPRPILATHENLAVSMAHGYGMVCRRIPAVMVHVSVGTANLACAALNSARENAAILLT